MKSAVLVVLAIALAACGGKSTPSSTMTKDSPPLIQGTGGTTYGGASYGGAAYGGASYGGMQYGGGGPNR